MVCKNDDDGPDCFPWTPCLGQTGNPAFVRCVAASPPPQRELRKRGTCFVTLAMLSPRRPGEGGRESQTPHRRGMMQICRQARGDLQSLCGDPFSMHRPRRRHTRTARLLVMQAFPATWVRSRLAPTHSGGCSLEGTLAAPAPSMTGVARRPSLTKFTATNGHWEEAGESPVALAISAACSGGDER